MKAVLDQGHGTAIVGNGLIINLHVHAIGSDSILINSKSFSKLIKEVLCRTRYSLDMKKNRSGFAYFLQS